jgi:hypothetical protein
MRGDEALASSVVTRSEFLPPHRAGMGASLASASSRRAFAALRLAVRQAMRFSSGQDGLPRRRHRPLWLVAAADVIKSYPEADAVIAP